MIMNLALSLVATAISFGFAGIVFRQFLSRRRPYQFVWSLALLIFGIGTLCQSLAEVVGWSALLYRVWYFTGAMIAAAVLGQGTIYLMAPRTFADASAAIVAAISLAGLQQVLGESVDLAGALTANGLTGSGFGSHLLIFLIPLNTYGTVALVGGALWSVYRAWRSGRLGRRALGTLLIAIGGLVVALGGTANRLGVPGLLYLSEMLGVAIIFIGYLQTVTRPRPAPPEPGSKRG